jgi:hypothetical protein
VCSDSSSQQGAYLEAARSHWHAMNEGTKVYLKFLVPEHVNTAYQPPKKTSRGKRGGKKKSAKTQ